MLERTLPTIFARAQNIYIYMSAQVVAYLTNQWRMVIPCWNPTVSVETFSGVASELFLSSRFQSMKHLMYVPTRVPPDECAHSNVRRTLALSVSSGTTVWGTICHWFPYQSYTVSGDDQVSILGNQHPRYIQSCVAYTSKGSTYIICHVPFLTNIR